MGDYLRDLGVPGSGSIQNYTGPGLSNGLFQNSVEFGTALPTNDLDALARLHDSAYAKYKDRAHRRAADKIFADAAGKIPNSEALLAKNAVRYGNQVKGSFDNLSKRASQGLPFGPVGVLGGLVYGAIENNLDLHDYMINGQKYEKEVLDYYKTDPHLDLQPGGRKFNQAETRIPRTRWNMSVYNPPDQTVAHATGAKLKDEYAKNQVVWDAAASKRSSLANVREKARKVLGMSSDQAGTAHVGGYGLPVEKGVGGAFNFTDKNGDSHWDYQPPRRKRKKRKNRVHVDNQ